MSKRGHKSYDRPEHLLDHGLVDGLVQLLLVHAGPGVDLEQVRAERGVEHHVVTQQLVTVVPATSCVRIGGGDERLELQTNFREY